MDVAAKAAGVNKRRLSRYLADHEDFAGQVATARRRAEVISTQAAAPPPSLGLEGSSCGALTPEGRSAFVALLEEHARDPQSRGCSKALDILAQLHFAQEILRMKAEAKRAETDAGAGDHRPMIVRVPALPPSREPEVIDAELVE